MKRKARVLAKRSAIPHPLSPLSSPTSAQASGGSPFATSSRAVETRRSEEHAPSAHGSLAPPSPSRGGRFQGERLLQLAASAVEARERGEGRAFSPPSSPSVGRLWGPYQQSSVAMPFPGASGESGFVPPPLPSPREGELGFSSTSFAAGGSFFPEGGATLHLTWEPAAGAGDASGGGGDRRDWWSEMPQQRMLPTRFRPPGPPLAPSGPPGPPLGVESRSFSSLLWATSPSPAATLYSPHGAASTAPEPDYFDFHAASAALPPAALPSAPPPANLSRTAPEINWQWHDSAPPLPEPPSAFFPQDADRHFESGTGPVPGSRRGTTTRGGRAPPRPPQPTDGSDQNIDDA
ncbi:unnamed protein product [Phaeothamnion confervicola]